MFKMIKYIKMNLNHKKTKAGRFEELLLNLKIQ
jgi:hypothetical protein